MWREICTYLKHAERFLGVSNFDGKSNNRVKIVEMKQDNSS